MAKTKSSLASGLAKCPDSIGQSDKSFVAADNRLEDGEESIDVFSQILSFGLQAWLEIDQLSLETKAFAPDQHIVRGDVAMRLTDVVDLLHTKGKGM
jgi:hypothetical protein